jgi:outer membrane lipoprotein carrier protein
MMKIEMSEIGGDSRSLRGNGGRSTALWMAARKRGGWIVVAGIWVALGIGVGGLARGEAPSTEPTAPPPASRELLAHIQTQLRTVDTMQADFVQKKRLAMLKHTLTISGQFAMQKPNKVVWIVNQPTRYAIKVNGDEITQWDQDTNNVQVMHVGGDPTFKAITEQIQAWFLGDYKTLEQSYDVFLLAERPLALRFAPKAGTMVSKLVKNIEVTFGKDQTQIDTMVVNETSGDSTALKYNNVRLNQPIPSSTWEIPPR